MLNVKPSAVARKADLPVAFRRHVGMFDVAYYSNDLAGQAPPSVGQSIADVNCVPHYDPGLLSISIWSNAEGLQLLDPTTNTWHAGPINTVEGQEDLGVIWLGKAAEKVNPNWKAGIHRVIYPASAGKRLTIWSEMCTVDQVHGDSSSEPVSEGDVAIPNIIGPGSVVSAEAGETKESLLLKIERKVGIPRSKVMRIDDFFKVRMEATFVCSPLSHPFAV